MSRKQKPSKTKANRASPSKENQQVPRGRLIVGIHSAKEAIKIRPHAIAEIYLRKNFEDNQDLQWFHDWAKKNNKPIKIEARKFFEPLAQTHQGLCLVVQERPQISYESLKDSGNRTVVILDGLEDPHNLGAILRTSWLMGVDAMFTKKQRSSALTATALKVASGAAEHVPVMEEASLVSVLKELKDMGFWIYALTHTANKTIWQEQLPEKVAWIIGSEGSGIGKPLLNACDIELKIPQQEASASYNASVAAALAMGESFRQRQL